MRRFVALLFAATLVASCSSTDDAAAPNTLPINQVSSTPGPAAPVPTTTVSVTTVPVTTVSVTTVAPLTSSTAPVVPSGDPTSERPFDVFTPSSYSPDTAMPLVVLLHGFGATGAIQEAYFKLQPLAEERGFLYVYPNGTINAIGRSFWNATDACCGFGSAVDDSAYLLALIEKVQADFNVDPKRIFLVGHSNGGFMSYRMACDHADKIAAIASLAGATFADESKCRPSEPVSVLEIHGTADGTIGYDGGSLLGGEHPGAEQSVADWATYNGCTGTAAVAPTRLDLEASIDGAESVVTQFGGCPPGGTAELWTIAGGTHIPALSATFTSDVIDFLLAHPKP